MWWVDHGWTPDTEHSHAISPLPSGTQGENTTKGLWAGIGQRDDSLITVTDKTDLTWRNLFSLLPSKSQ